MIDDELGLKDFRKKYSNLNRKYINRFWHEPYAIVNGYNGIFDSESLIEIH